MSMYQQSLFGTGSSSREIESEQYFIAKVKNQKHKVELLAAQFKQQQVFISQQEALIQSLRKQNQSLRQEIDNYMQKQQNYLFQISDRMQIISQLQNKINYLLSQSHKLQQQRFMKKQQLRIQEIKQEQRSQSNKNHLIGFKDEVEWMRKQVITMKQRVKDKCNEVKQLHQCLELASTTITKVQADLLRSQKNYEIYSHQSNQICKRYQLQIKSLTQTLESTKNKLAVEHKSFTQIQSDIMNKDLKINHLTNLVMQKDADINKFQQNIRRFLGHIKQLQNDIIQRDKLIDSLYFKQQSRKQTQQIKKQLYKQRQIEYTQLDGIISGLKLKQ